MLSPVGLLVSSSFPSDVFRELRRFPRDARGCHFEAKLLRMQLFKADGRVVGKAVALRPLPGFLASLLTLIVSLDSLRTELEKLHHHLGLLLDFVGARNTS
jgi:hypothetical protein